MRNRRNSDKGANNRQERPERQDRSNRKGAGGGQHPHNQRSQKGPPGKQGHHRGAQKNAGNQPSTLIESPIRMPKGGRQAQEPANRPKLPPRRYGVVFFDTLAAAKNDVQRLQELARGYDQLNIVIRAEASMDDPELAAVGKVFAGAAWALIHDRRVAEGWYNDMH